MRGAEPLAFQDMALLDAGALGDPLVGGVDHAREIVIGQHVRRHIAVDAGNGGAGNDGHESGPPAFGRKNRPNGRAPGKLTLERA